MSLYKAYFRLKSNTLPESFRRLVIRNTNKRKEVQRNAQNLSTQKASEKERARLQKENGNRRWQKCPEKKTR